MATMPPTAERFRSIPRSGRGLFDLYRLRRSGHFRLSVEVESDASEPNLLEWLDRTLERSPGLDVVRRPQPMSIDLRITAPTGS